VAFFFPDDLRQTPYAKVYQRLTPVERLMLLREFVGVTYRRRFLFFTDQSQSRTSRARSGGSFRRNLAQAAARQYRSLRIRPRAWRQAAVLRPYLRLVLRHYLFGFLVQGVRPHLDYRRLPVPDENCYYDFFPNLAAILWFNRHRPDCDRVLDELLESVIAHRERRLYVYALLTASRLRELVSFAEVGKLATELFPRYSQSGRTPLGVELEFSNLGRFATFDKPFKSGRRDPLFANMSWYEDFFLDDVSWRLGGYLDTHIRGWSFLRKFRLGPRPGGFYEYSLVRLDYPRAFSMPLAKDCGLVSLYIDEVIKFVAEISPHSLHVNLEKVAFGAPRPELDDYLCLLLLGGDFQVDETGRWRECRMADNELRGVIQRRRHCPARGRDYREVMEYSFLRLRSPGERDYSYLPLLMTIKGFQYGFNLALSCRDQVQGMLAWAHNPKPLSQEAIASFLEKIDRGWCAEGGNPPELRQRNMTEIRRLLERANCRLER